MKSLTGYVFIFGGVTVSQASKKIGMCSKCTKETKFNTCSMTFIEVSWIRRFLENPKVNGVLYESITIMNDNQFVIQVIKMELWAKRKTN